MQPAPHTDAALAARALENLQNVVAIDSQSDEASTSIPSSEGQRILAAWVGEAWRLMGAQVERDGNANVLATFPGRGARAGEAPLALVVHIDTARGTQAVPSLHVRAGWPGDRIPYPQNPGLCVDLETYPAVEEFVGQDVVFGEGVAPFGLDDKLGLTHLLTLGWLLATAPPADHPPILLVGRPDEEIGRHEAIVALADLFARRGVRSAYTIDGILPFEINVENFNAAVAHVHFAGGPATVPGEPFVVRLGGVNTHGATAHAEGHRTALRFVAEWLAAAPEAGLVAFESDALRDCDGIAIVRTTDRAHTEAALAAVVGPHLKRGASWERVDATLPESAAAATALAWVQRFYASNPGFTLGAEDSSGRDGYTHPYRLVPADGGLRLDLRLRDFEPDGLAARKAHVLALAPAATVEDQYVNMGPRLAAHPELVERAVRAAAVVGITPRMAPIRGGTGVDPFLDRGIPVANLGTGYFSPESEKELTSVQMMVRHARWLYALVQA